MVQPITAPTGITAPGPDILRGVGQVGSARAAKDQAIAQQAIAFKSIDAQERLAKLQMEHDMWLTNTNHQLQRDMLDAQQEYDFHTFDRQMDHKASLSNFLMGQAEWRDNQKLKQAEWERSMAERDADKRVEFLDWIKEQEGDFNAARIRQMNAAESKTLFERLKEIETKKAAIMGSLDGGPREAQLSAAINNDIQSRMSILENEGKITGPQREMIQLMADNNTLFRENGLSNVLTFARHLTPDGDPADMIERAMSSGSSNAQMDLKFLSKATPETLRMIKNNVLEASNQSDMFLDKMKHQDFVGELSMATDQRDFIDRIPLRKVYSLAGMEGDPSKISKDIAERNLENFMTNNYNSYRDGSLDDDRHRAMDALFGSKVGNAIFTRQVGSRYNAMMDGQLPAKAKTNLTDDEYKTLMSNFNRMNAANFAKSDIEAYLSATGGSRTMDIRDFSDALTEEYDEITNQLEELGYEISPLAKARRGLVDLVGEGEEGFVGPVDQFDFPIPDPVPTTTETMPDGTEVEVPDFNSDEWQQYLMPERVSVMKKGTKEKAAQIPEEIKNDVEVQRLKGLEGGDRANSAALYQIKSIAPDTPDELAVLLADQTIIDIIRELDFEGEA